MREQRNAGRDQLGTGRLDQRAGSVSRAEADPVHGTRPLAVLELRLRDCRLEVDVPERRRLELVGLASLEQRQERALRDALGDRADRRVGHRPVDREPEGAPERFEGRLVGLGQPQAQLDEVRPRDRDRLLLRRGLRGLEVRVVGDGRIASHAVVVLHATLGREPVVVPAHGIEDLAAAHPLVARDGVGVGVGEDVSDVKRAADRRRRSVDRVDALARRRAVERVGAVALPGRAPLALEAVQRRLLGDLCRLIGARGGQALIVSAIPRAGAPDATKPRTSRTKLN